LVVEAGVDDTQVVPLLVNTLPDVPADVNPVPPVVADGIAQLAFVPSVVTNLPEFPV
jgi:hypothetical protein